MSATASVAWPRSSLKLTICLQVSTDQARPGASTFANGIYRTTRGPRSTRRRQTGSLDSIRWIVYSSLGERDRSGVLVRVARQVDSQRGGSVSASDEVGYETASCRG
jgi:hypothetical protein